jgi:hypothetical protein
LLTRVATRLVWRGEHFALIGVNDKELTDLDAKTKKLVELRITPIYYPVTVPDHPALQTLMDALECYDAAMVDQIAATAMRLPPLHPTVVPSLTTDSGFVQMPVADDSAKEWNKLPQVNPHQYVERSAEFRLFDGLASNVRVRIICLLGLGGTGKTTLLRRVLDEKSLANARFPDGVLIYPIRDDAQADAIVDALCDRFPPLAPLDRDDRGGRLHHAEQVLRRRRMLLVLDGAELLQERPGQAEHGRFLSEDLRSLLLSIAREGQALVVITSRFAPIEFKEHLGTSYQAIDLGGFTPGESVAFLNRAGVDGDAKALTRVHKAFEGHPLGLALFAGAVTGAHTSALAGGSVPGALERLRTANSLDERLAALLDWYQKWLSPAQLAMLTLLAVYPTSVSQVELHALLQASRVKAGDHILTVMDGEEVLSSLKSLGLIQFDADQGRYECHAVVRQGMRRRDPDAARAAITSLTEDAPTSTLVTTIDELQRVVDAIEIAVESLGDFLQASRLLVTRLASGQRFFDLAVPNIGVACLGRLVSDDPWQDGQTRRQAAETKIGKRSVGVYLAWLRQFHEWLGNLSEAERLRRLDGDFYINWTSTHDKDHHSFWIDGLRYACARGDAHTRRALRAEVWQRCGALIRRAVEDPSVVEAEDLVSLGLAFADLTQWRDDPWFRLTSDICRHSLTLPTMALVRHSLELLERRVNGFKPDRKVTPIGTFRQQWIATKHSDIRARANRLDLALYRTRFLELARSSGSGSASALFDLVCHCHPEGDREEEEMVTLAQAFLSLADSLDRARAGPRAALARSWAAEQLIYVGQAAAPALEWSNCALDICGEDQQERTRGLYMRGKAQLALGHFTDAIEDACAAMTLASPADERFQIAETLQLRWRAAEQAGDDRANEWEEEMRTFCSSVYQQKDYDSLPDFDLLPGDQGFHGRYPDLDWPDDLLLDVPPQLDALKAIADGTFDDLLERYREDVLRS